MNTDAIDEFLRLLEEMADESKDGVSDDILFTHELCVNASSQLSALKADNARLQKAVDSARETIKIMQYRLAPFSPDEDKAAKNWLAANPKEE